jgi:hypothetical protein
LIFCYILYLKPNFYAEGLVGSSYRYASLWWKDICELEVGVGASRWLGEVINRRIGSGDLTRFWKDVWLGDSPLCVIFPRLFSIVLNKDASVREMMIDPERDNLVWNFQWRRPLFQWKEEMVVQCQASLVNVVLTNEVDKVVFKSGRRVFFGEIRFCFYL